MRTALLAALLLSPFAARAQDGALEAEVRAAAGRAR